MLTMQTNHSIKLVAIDMDGTLLNHKGKISKTTIETLRELRKQGKIFVICTGRNYIDARKPLEEAGLECDLICMNGALTCTYDGKVVSSHSVDKKKVEKLITFLHTKETIIDIMTEVGSFTTTPRQQFMKAFEENILLPTGDENFGVEQFRFVTKDDFMCLNHNVYKISAIHRERAILQDIRSRLMETEDFNIVASAPTNLEITHNYAKKGKALLEYANRRHIKVNELMTIGDSGNDVSMLALKEAVTVVMENGMEEAKSVAKYMTRSNTEDGVAFAIHQLALNRELLPS